MTPVCTSTSGEPLPGVPQTTRVIPHARPSLSLGIFPHLVRRYTNLDGKPHEGTVDVYLVPTHTSTPVLWRSFNTINAESGSISHSKW